MGASLAPLARWRFAHGNGYVPLAGGAFVCENVQERIAGEIPTVHIVFVLRSSDCLGGSHCAVCM